MVSAINVIFRFVARFLIVVLINVKRYVIKENVASVHVLFLVTAHVEKVCLHFHVQRMYQLVAILVDVFWIVAYTDVHNDAIKISVEL